MSLLPAVGERYLSEALPYLNASNSLTDYGFIEAVFTRNSYIGAAEPQRIYYTYYRDSIYATQGGYHGYPLHGRYIERYPGKGLKVLGHYRYGLRVGKWQYWDEKGVRRTVAHWKEGREPGRFAVYDEEGGLQKQQGRGSG